LAYEIQIQRTAQKQMLSLPRQAQFDIARAIDRLITTPRPPGCKKLRGTELWRFRVGRYRVIYTIDDDVRKVTVVKVALRREDTYE
jgi:mRNA interferase RelE/StbE